MSDQTTTATPEAETAIDEHAADVELLEDEEVDPAEEHYSEAYDVPLPGEEDGSPFADLELEADGLPAAEDIRNALRAVVDPEIGYNIVDLGLVYEVTKADGGDVKVLMTLTSMGCPLTELIHQQCTVVLTALPGVENVEVEFTFSPPWDTSMITDWVAEELRAMGMNV